ncbi:carboxylase, partial [Streptomyces toxytricini]
MTEHKLLVVGGRIQTLRKAAALGIRFVLIQHKDQFVPEAARLAEAVIIADYTDWETTRPLVEAAHRAYGFTRVVSITEPGLVPAARISDHLGLGGTTEEVAELLRDKHAMRRHLAASDSPGVRALSVAAAEVDGPEALAAFGAEHGYP